MIPRIFIPLITLAFVIAACSSTSTTSNTPSTDSFVRPSATIERPPIRTTLLQGTPVPAPQLAGKFIYAPGDGSVWIQDPANGSPKNVLQPSPEVFADAPNFAPDGKSFVYIHSSLTQQGTAQNSIYRSNLDGTENKVIADPPDVKTSFNWPHYSLDGKWIYYTSSYPVPPNKEHSEVDRIPAAGGTPQKIVDDARLSSESPDGTKIAFIRFNFDTFTSSLVVADSDGQNQKVLVTDDVFITVSTPEFSPDGSQILFTASGPNTRPLPGVSMRTPDCQPQLLCMFAKTAHADGLPWDLWTVTPDGSKFARLSQIGADSPWPAWSRDGKQIAFFDTSGQYLLILDTKVVSQISPNGGHGVFGWWQP